MSCSPSFLPAGPVIGALALALVACSGPRMEILDRPVTESKAARALTNSTALNDTTRDTLRSEDLLSLYKQDAPQAIRVLAERYQQNPSEARRRALVEVSSDQILVADQAQTGGRAWSPGRWRVREPAFSPGTSLTGWAGGGWMVA